uniref:EOG090X0BAY n=1 Tax=Daphnia barbata TaxID=414587 RepID=A0A4Y7M3Y3_9CRUS|nr:EOG090X0BAY [Daphnia barbata]
MDSKQQYRGRKRVTSDEESLGADSKGKELCKYGKNCYRKNSYHLQKFRHPHRDQSAKPEPEEVQDESKTCKISSCPTTTKEYKELQSDNGTHAVMAEQEKDSPSSGMVNNEFPSSPLDVKENLQRKFLVEMPEDFYQFWAFCQSICQQNTLVLFKETLGLKLVGPFELLDQTSKENKINSKSEIWLTKWRFYYDPPEFQTVMVGDLRKGYHIGYFRDAPKDVPAFVGSNTESEGCTITPMAANLFCALRQEIFVGLKEADALKKGQLMALEKQLEDWASKNGVLIEKQSQILKRRKKQMVAKTFYECGIVVPVNSRTQVGYRKIPETNDKIKKICKTIIESQDLSEQNENSDALQELVTYVQYANDESDYGMGLELGLDLLAFGGEIFHTTVLHLLGVAYELLERTEFAVILKAHLKQRHRLAAGNAEYYH